MKHCIIFAWCSLVVWLSWVSVPIFTELSVVCFIVLQWLELHSSREWEVAVVYSKWPMQLEYSRLSTFSFIRDFEQQLQLGESHADDVMGAVFKTRPRLQKLRDSSPSSFCKCYVRWCCIHSERFQYCGYKAAWNKVESDRQMKAC